MIKCLFESCHDVVSYNNYGAHIKNCYSNPNLHVCCPFCNETILDCKTEEHNAQCVNFLNCKITELEIQLEKSRKIQTAAINEVEALKVQLAKTPTNQVITLNKII